MPLEPYRRGAVWWARGTVDYEGLPITGYLRESTRASTESGARAWIEARTREERSRVVSGIQERPITFMEAVLLYNPTKQMAKYLVPILNEFGALPAASITPQMVLDLGPKLYPSNCTDSWRRWVITPTRAVINRAHRLGKCPPIRIEGYTTGERVKQDRHRGKPSRVEREPGNWQWLLRFREQAGPYHAALALFMFVTGARVGQACRMEPRHLDLQNCKVCVPAGKDQDDRWVAIPIELVAELANLPAKSPRGWARYKKRVFGFASADGCRKGWRTACKRAGIEHIPPHSAGRHGFGQEMAVRQGVDVKAVGKFGGWSDTAMLHKTYTHAEDFEAKIHAGLRTGLVQAEIETGLKLLRKKG